MGEAAKVQKIGDDLGVIFPKDVVEKLHLEEGCLVEIESFICSGTSGVRIKNQKRIQRNNQIALEIIYSENCNSEKLRVDTDEK